MTGHIEHRRHKRERADIAVELIWRDQSGQRRIECGRIVDRSLSGVAVVSQQPLAVSSSLILHAPGMNVVALSQVRSCVWRRTRYRMGMEFLEKAALAPADPAAEPDYHELLRAGVTGSLDLVNGLYRTLAFRYHPDNGETGNAEIFLRVGEVYRILSVAQPPRPESQIAKRAVESAWSAGIEGLEEMRIAVLGLLYHRRITDYLNATVSARDLESLTGLKANELGFILWYLREKGAVSLCDCSSDFSITAAGVDILEGAQQPA